jgi:hypothetical protein
MTMDSFYHRLVKEFNISKDNIDNNNSDLYVLPRTSTEFVQIVNFVKKENQEYKIRHSDIEGQDWYGHNFIEIFFAYEPYWESKKFLGAV